MKKITLAILALLTLLTIGVAAGGGWYVNTKLPVRKGTVDIKGLKAKVTVQYDERGVPHIYAANERDLYRALGFVHAQDRLFQMEMVRRLANGELAEIFGPKLLDSDKLFRTLELREHAKTSIAQMDMDGPLGQSMLAYLDGINQFQATHPAPMEFDLLGIPKRPFKPEDVAAVTGYLAYSFATAFKTEPLMTFIRDKLGPHHLAVFDTEGHPEGGIRSLQSAAASHGAPSYAMTTKDWAGLNHLAQVTSDAVQEARLGAFHGSNGWVISGKRTVSGKPILAGDPHIGYSAPSVWYEAHLSTPSFELYGHFLALNPQALLGHNSDFGWTLTMFENDDIDLIAEKINPANPKQVWHRDQWVDLQTRTETIKVKGAADTVLQLQRGPHGPFISDAFKDQFGSTPIAMWWAFLETENPLLQGVYELNRADTREKARAAAMKMQAPGLNLLWASAEGDIAWWATGKLPQRPVGVNPMFILDAAKGEAEKPGFFNFSFNPHEENPPRGYIVSANEQPGGVVPVPGYYLPADRAKRLDDALQEAKPKWTTDKAANLQLDLCVGYPQRVLSILLPIMDQVITDANDKAFLEPLQKWDGCYTPNSVAASLFSQLSYELARAAFEDELGEVQFKNLIGTPVLDHALPLLIADADSPWWDNVKTPQKENRFETIRIAWGNTLKHLQGLYGSSLLDWSWGQTHTLTLAHPLGVQKPFNWLFNVGPFPAPGGREAPNNIASKVGPAPWSAAYGPSTRRVIDFGAPEKSIGINPLGQSGVLFDKHYADQVERYLKGSYVRQRMDDADVQSHSKEKLILQPGPSGP